MSYDLTIHFSEPGNDPDALRAFLDAFPGATRAGDNYWVLEPDDSVHAEFDLNPIDEGPESPIESITVNIPYGFLDATGEPALRLCFAIAEQFGGRVYDEQMGDYITPASQEEVIAAHAGYLAAANAVLHPTPKLDAWANAAKNQPLPVMVAILLLSMLGAVGVVFWLELPEDYVEYWLFGSGLCIAVLLFSLKIGIDRWLVRHR